MQAGKADWQCASEGYDCVFSCRDEASVLEAVYKAGDGSRKRRLPNISVNEVCKIMGKSINHDGSELMDQITSWKKSIIPSPRPLCNDKSGLITSLHEIYHRVVQIFQGTAVSAVQFCSILKQESNSLFFYRLAW